MSKLDGKTALVTGASRGIGAAIATRLGRDGATVAVHYGRDEAAADAVVQTIRDAGGSAFSVRALLGDDPGVIDALFADLDRELGDAGLDILVNNAAIGCATTIEQTTPELFAGVFAVNVRDLFFLTQRALERMTDGGRIINVSSGATRVAFPEGIPYAMTKGAVDTLGLALAKHLGPRGITVNGVAPGVVDTDVNAAWLRDNEEAWSTVAAMSPLGRVAEPDDIAGVVGFLASDDARWITGRTLDASGGATI
jgi:3-oxoacyl-[acyl-carrier protein] reductase